MNKKGFTLIELMAVIILLGILSLIATITVNNVLKENKKKTCLAQIENIKSGAKNWASKNVFNLPDEDGQSISVGLKELQDNGFVDKDIKNPVTGNAFENWNYVLNTGTTKVKIYITKIDNNYQYDVKLFSVLSDGNEIETDLGCDE